MEFFNEFKVDFGWGILEPALMDGCIQAYVDKYGLAGGAEEEAARTTWRNGFKFDLKDMVGDPSGRRKITRRIRELVKLEERSWLELLTVVQQLRQVGPDGAAKDRLFSQFGMQCYMRKLRPNPETFKCGSDYWRIYLDIFCDELGKLFDELEEQQQFSMVGAPEGEQLTEVEQSTEWMVTLMLLKDIKPKHQADAAIGDTDGFGYWSAPGTVADIFNRLTANLSFRNHPIPDVGGEDVGASAGAMGGHHRWDGMGWEAMGGHQ